MSWLALEGEVLCGAVAARCVCSKVTDHLEHGDEVHRCVTNGCMGSWTGIYGTDDFGVVSLPTNPVTALFGGLL